MKFKNFAIINLLSYLRTNLCYSFAFCWFNFRYKVHFKRWRNLCYTICFFILFLSFGESRGLYSKPFREPSIRLNPVQEDKIKNGDLIFRRANGIGSNMVYTVDQQSVFSHVGLVFKEGMQTKVIHILPSGVGGDTFVRMDSLESFLQTISLAAIYRLRQSNPDIANRAILKAKSFIGKARFDLEFDLSNSDELYCTELVWQAYKSAGIDLVDGSFDQLSLPFMKSTQFILPSRLAQSHWLYEVVRFSSQ